MKYLYPFLALLLLLLGCSSEQTEKIDRKALVTRHNVVLTEADPLTPLSVGNGNFAYTVDITGMQTIPEFYDSGIPLNTMSNWGWHSFPSEQDYTVEDASKNFDSYGRPVPYVSIHDNDAGKWLRQNPHRLNLGRIGLAWTDPDADPITVDDIENPNQVLNLWEGTITSEFTLKGKKVKVVTVCDPESDQLGFSIESSLVESGKLGVSLKFPYPSGEWGPGASVANSSGMHDSSYYSIEGNRHGVHRNLMGEEYFTAIVLEDHSAIRTVSEHQFLVLPTQSNLLSVSFGFNNKRVGEFEPDVSKIFIESDKQWSSFWNSGAAIDLSESTAPEAHELERRIILSQYLTRIQCAGEIPPAETGLTANSWYGKFHLEMHWWHAVQFAKWGRPELLEKSMPFYKKILANAKATAAKQGYRGARWPKMVGPDGREGPSWIGVFLIWQQPHPIYYLEMLYSMNPEDDSLKEYSEVVFETAEFMASYVHWVEEEQRYILGAPMIPAQEIYDYTKTTNPPFELSYWEYGLRTAQLWRERLGMERNEKWDHVIDHLAEWPQQDGRYLNVETGGIDHGEENHDHPSVLGAYGMLPSDRVDIELMENTLDYVMNNWDWPSTWGWDYPMTAMTATRLGQPEVAIQALMMDVQKNTYLKNGHNYQDENLPLYLPGNGGLLTAIALMAGGWEGAPDRANPGFPDSPEWVVRSEGFNKEGE